MTLPRWVTAVAALALVAASALLHREAFRADADADADAAHANEAAAMEYIANESYQAFMTLGVDAATKNVLRALADVVRGKYVNGVYPSESVRLHVLRLSHDLADSFARGISTYAVVERRAQEKVAEAAYAAGIEKRRANYVDTLERTIFDEYGSRRDFEEATCADAATSPKQGVRWMLAARCG